MANTEAATEVQSDFAPLGEVLLAARKAKKLTVLDVSNTLRISPKQIEAIENNAFDLLPEAAITRGFIRNYARMLNVESEPLLASHRERVPEIAPTSLSVKTTTRQKMTEQDNKSLPKYVFAVILALLMLLSWLFYQNNILTSAKSPSKQGSEIVTPLPEAALPAAERQVNQAPDASASVVVEAPIALPSVSPAMPVPTVTDAALSATSVASQPEAPVAVNESTVDSSVNQFKVSMTFTENTWVSIKNAAGKVVFEKEFSAGETGGYDGEPPLKITIGNAKNTQLYYLGQAVDLAPLTKGNVARVNLP